MLNKLCNNISKKSLKILLLMFFVTSIVIMKNNVKASTPNDFEYTRQYDYNGVEYYQITKYNGTDTAVEIPSTIGGHSITSIAASTFYNNTNIQSVVIPNEVSTIESSAFRGCTSLESITLPESITRLNPNTFYGCISLKSIIIPENVLRIGSECFRDCFNLESVEIYSREIYIDDYCFYNCQKIVGGSVKIYYARPNWGIGVFINTGLGNVTSGDHFRDFNITSATIDVGVDSIEADTFNGCEKLKTLYINNPNFNNFTSSASGGKGALYGCNNLENVVITDENSYFTVEDGIIYTKDKTTLVRCLPAKRGKVNIPETVTTINKGAFHGCKYLEDILVIPDSVTEIKEYAFYGCMSEIPIKISENLSRLTECSFANSKFTGNLVIPNSVTQIRKYAFYNCSNFTGTLQVGDNVSWIDECAFYNCSGLTGDIVFSGNLNWIGELAFASCENLNGKIDFQNNKDSCNICDFAFAQDLNIKEVKANSTISSINTGAFLNCKSLEKISNINKASAYSLAGCSSLKNLNIDNLDGSDILRGLKNLEELRINNSTTTLGRTVLADCPNLKTLYIPSSVTTIADNAFYKTENIQDIYVDNNRDNISYSHILESVCKHVHYNDSKYTIQKIHNDDIEITDIESDYDEGYKVGSTYKFKVAPKTGYTINNLRVVLKIDEDENTEGYEIQKELTAVEDVFTIENINRNMQIVFETNSSLINPNAESDS